METQKSVTNLVQFFNQKGPIIAKPPSVPKPGRQNEETDDFDRDNIRNNESEEEIPESFEDVIYYGARRVDDDDSDEDTGSYEVSNADDDDYCRPNAPIFSRSVSVREDETNNDSSNEDEEKTKEQYHQYEEVIYNEDKETKNVRPPPRRNIKDKVLHYSPLRTKYPDKIEELQAKATATLETFKNNPLTEASYQSYKKLLMQTRGELKVMKPKNKKKRNKLENAVAFTECVMKELDDEFTKYMTSIRSKNKK